MKTTKICHNFSLEVNYMAYYVSRTSIYVLTGLHLRLTVESLHSFLLLLRIYEQSINKASGLLSCSLTNIAGDNIVRSDRCENVKPYIRIALTFTILGIIHRPVFYLKHTVSDTGFCVRLQVVHTGRQASSVDWAQQIRYHLMTETESSLRKFVSWKRGRMVDNVQNFNHQTASVV
jgi:hypothetical protein